MKKILLLTTWLITQITYAQVPTYVPTNGLVGYWPFNGNANDESGNGNNGTVNGATLTSDRFGQNQHAYSFNGNGNDIGVNLIQGVDSFITLSFWIKTNDINDIVISINDSTFMGTWGLNGVFMNQDGSISFKDNEGDWGIIPSLTAINNNQWRHVLVMTRVNYYANNIYDPTVSGINNRFYIDGILKYELTTTNYNNGQYGWPFFDNTIGSFIKFGSGGNGSGSFSGQLDDIGIWNRPLSQQEITNLYNNSSYSCVTPNSIISSNSTTIPLGGLLLTASYNSTYSYQWLKNNVAISGANSNTYNATTAGSYSLIETFGTCADTSNSIILTIANNNICLPSYVPTNGLVGYWPFCGNANDASGNGNNGTVNGATLTSDRNGNSNSAYYFNGSSRITCFQDSLKKLIDYNRKFTVSVWMCRDAFGNTNTTSSEKVIWAFDGTNSYPYKRVYSRLGQSPNMTYVTAGRYNASTMGSVGDVGIVGVDSTNYIYPNNWYNYTYVYDGANILVYMNGLLMQISYYQNNLQYYGATMSGNDSFVQSFVVGANNQNNWHKFLGKLDDVGVWKRALSASEVNSLFNGTSCVTPTATITPVGATTFCTGDSVVLNANTDTSFSYQWLKNNTLITGATTASYSASTSGSYSVIISNATNCADTSAATAVTVNALPSASITPASTTTFCTGGSVVLNANTGAGLIYIWKKNGTNISGATAATYTATTAGVYTVQVSNSSSCSATSTGITITVNTAPTASITAATATTFCAGGSVVLNANTGTGLTYQWKKNGTNITGATSASYTATTQGNYVVVVSNSNACTAASSATTVTVNAQPTVTLTNLPALVNIQSANIALNGAPTGGTYSGVGVTGTSFSPAAAGLGTAHVNYAYTTSAGCSGNASQNTVVYDTTGVVCTTYDTTNVTIVDTTTVTIYDTVTTYLSVTDTLIINQTITGLVAPNNTNTIRIFPNPANDHMTINYGNYALMSGYSLNITNALGQVVFTTPISLASSYLDISTWGGNGTYFVNIINPQGVNVNTRKIVLQ